MKNIRTIKNVTPINIKGAIEGSTIASKPRNPIDGFVPPQPMLIPSDGNGGKTSTCSAMGLAMGRTTFAGVTDLPLVWTSGEHWNTFTCEVGRGLNFHPGW